MFKPVLALAPMAAANDIESIVVIRLPHLTVKQEGALLRVLNELMLTYSLTGPCLCLYRAGKQMDTLRTQLQGHGVALPTNVHEGCHQLVLQPTTEPACCGLSSTGTWVSLKNPGHVSVWTAQIDYRPVYGPDGLGELQDLLASRVKATDFSDRFVNSQNSDMNLSHKVLTFAIPKAEVADFPCPFDTPKGRLIMEFAQPEVHVAVRTGPPRVVGESSYLHWVNTQNGRRASDSAVFGLEAPARGPAHYRKMNVQQVTLSHDAPHSARLGTVLADTNLILLMHGNAIASPAPSFVEWGGLRTALGLPPRSPDYDWNFRAAAWTTDWGTLSNPLAHLISIPPHTVVLLRTLVGEDCRATVSRHEELTLRCFQATTLLVRCWTPAQLRGLLHFPDAEECSVQSCYRGYLTHLSRKSAAPPSGDNSLGAFATPPKRPRNASSKPADPPRDTPHSPSDSPAPSPRPRGTPEVRPQRSCVVTVDDRASADIANPPTEAPTLLGATASHPQPGVAPGPSDSCSNVVVNNAPPTTPSPPPSVPTPSRPPTTELAPPTSAVPPPCATAPDSGKVSALPSPAELGLSHRDAVCSSPPPLAQP